MLPGQVLRPHKEKKTSAKQLPPKTSQKKTHTIHTLRQKRDLAYRSTEQMSRKQQNKTKDKQIKMLCVFSGLTSCVSYMMISA
ncbi:MAG: hypothetical protein CL932_14825 [Deltaproteobacteria bacterium]|nr:hypothetical protein [Deltaproteobacteria bacterium]